MPRGTLTEVIVLSAANGLLGYHHIAIFSCTANSCECSAAVRAFVDCIHLSIASDLVEI